MGLIHCCTSLSSLTFGPCSGFQLARKLLKWTIPTVQRHSSVFAVHVVHAYAEEMNQDCIVRGGYCVQSSTLTLTEMGMCIMQRS